MTPHGLVLWGCGASPGARDSPSAQPRVGGGVWSMEVSSAHHKRRPPGRLEVSVPGGGVGPLTRTLALQTVQDGRQFLKYVDPRLGVPLPERDYGGNCLIYDADNETDPFHNVWVRTPGGPHWRGTLCPRVRVCPHTPQHMSLGPGRRCASGPGCAQGREASGCEDITGPGPGQGCGGYTGWGCMRPASHPQDKLDGFVPAHFIGWYLKVRQAHGRLACPVCHPPCVLGFCWSWVDVESGLTLMSNAGGHSARPPGRPSMACGVVAVRTMEKTPGPALCLPCSRVRAALGGADAEGVPLPRPQTLMIRDWWTCTIVSVMFEFLEYSLEHQLPNFSECWWDHVGAGDGRASALAWPEACVPHPAGGRGCSGAGLGRPDGAAGSTGLPPASSGSWMC